MYVYIIIENVNRELYSRLLIASELLKKKNCHIVLGNKDYIRDCIHKLPPGTIIEKGGNYRLENYFKKYKEFNHTVYVLDEESYTFASTKQYFKLNLDKQILDYVDGILAVNKLQRDIIKKKFKKIKVYLTGNPKFEIYKNKYIKIFEKEKFLIKKKFNKKIILFTSRFAHINPNKKKLDDIDIVDKVYLKTSKAIFNLFLKLTKVVAKKNKLFQIVYRPHPSENIDMIKKMFKNISNIHVEYSLSAPPWILASDVIIHNRCSTGIESILLRKPTISYDPIKYKSMHNRFFSLLGKESRSIKQVQYNIDLVFKNKILLNKNDKKIFNYYCHENENNLPEKKIAKLIQKKCKKKINYFHFYLDKQIIMLKEIYTKYYIKGKTLENYNYRKQKFGILNKTLIQEKLYLINKIKKYKNNFKIKQFLKDVYIIEKI